MDDRPRIVVQLTILSLAVGTCGCKEELPPRPDASTSATRPSSTSGDSAADPTAVLDVKPTAPHQGRLLMIPPERGYIEWIPDPEGGTATFFVLNGRMEPVLVRQTPILVLASPAGPQECLVEPLGSSDGGAGFIARSDLLERPLPEGLIRLALGADWHRVALPTRPMEAESSQTNGATAIPGGAP